MIANPSRTTAIAQAALLARPVASSSFVRLMSSKAPVHWFRSTMRPFLGAVNGWSQLLGLLITRLPTPAQRLVAIENLVDEHGHGDLSMSHVATFRRLIKSLDEAGRIPDCQRVTPPLEAEVVPAVATKDIKQASLSHHTDDCTVIGGDSDDVFSEEGSERSSDHGTDAAASIFNEEEAQLLAQLDNPAVTRFLDIFKGTTTWQELAGALGKIINFTCHFKWKFASK